VKIELSDKLKKLPPYLFIEIDKMKKKALADGVDIINLGIGDPDLPTLKPIIDEMAGEIYKPENHQYPLGSGLLDFKKAVSEWYKERYNVTLEPSCETMALIGSKEGIGHIHLAFINPGDVVLCPDPGYPVYNAGTIFAEGEPYFMPLLEENGFMPDYTKIPADILKRAKLLFINYPNNPTAAVATRKFFLDTVELAKKHGIIVCHDAAYSEVYYDGQRPLSFMQIEGAKDVGIEFHSFSKTFNMTGWRLGYAVGNREVLAGLAAVKENIDSGAFHAIQKAGITALKLPVSWTDEIRSVYQKRRDTLVAGLRSLGWNVESPKAAFYVWIKVPSKFKDANANAKSISSELVKYLLTKCGIVSTPGVGFGSAGEGYIRMTVCAPEARLKEAVERIRKIW